MSFDRLKRREFVALLGGAAATWPLAARAQQPVMPVIGFLSSRSPGESASVVAAFRKGLNGTGYIEGQNLVLEFRWADGEYDRLPVLAHELVSLPVSAIAATGDAVSALAAKGATTSIPIIFVIGGDPVRFGLVASINRPGGNISDISLVSGGLGAKRLSLLHELIPNAAAIALLLNPENPNAELERQDIVQAGDTLGQRIVVPPKQA